MNPNKIPPIPKNISKLIEEIDYSKYQNTNPYVRFYSYFMIYYKRLYKITVAVKSRKGMLFMKQVAIYPENSCYCFIKDMTFSHLCGYCVGWYEQGLDKQPKWYDTGEWELCIYGYTTPTAPTVNKELALKLDRYKYSAVDKYSGDDALKYLNIYREYPIAEMLVKLGLCNLTTSKQILRLLKIDPSFRKWIYRNKEELSSSYYNVKVILDAFEKGGKLNDLQDEYNYKKEFDHIERNSRLKQLFKREEVLQFIRYIHKQDTNIRSYEDYLTACDCLGLDMTLPKNRYPHNFRQWHDIRIDQMHTKEAEENRAKNEKYYNDFEAVAKKYELLERNLKDNFVCIIAKSPDDLVNEGDKLHHCVGRMNYGQKFAREESLIFFVRDKLAISTPLVTLEYSLKDKKVLQCYGDHDSKPPQEILEFVNEKWLPYANRKLRKILNGNVA